MEYGSKVPFIFLLSASSFFFCSVKAELNLFNSSTRSLTSPNSISSEATFFSISLSSVAFSSNWVEIELALRSLASANSFASNFWFCSSNNWLSSSLTFCPSFCHLLVKSELVLWESLIDCSKAHRSDSSFFLCFIASCLALISASRLDWTEVRALYWVCLQ